MILRQVVELSAIASAYCEVVVERAAPIPATCLAGYLKAGRELPRSWHRRLDELQSVFTVLPRSENESFAHELLELHQESAATELLVRVFGTLLTAYDQHRASIDAAPIARRVWVDHLEFRCRLLNYVLNLEEFPEVLLIRLHKTRRRLERWTDVLLGPLVVGREIHEFAHDLQRAIDFGSEHQQLAAEAPPGHLWDMILAGLRLAIPRDLGTLSPDSRLYRQLMRTILTTLPDEAFDSAGRLKGPLIRRLERSLTG